MQGYVEIEQCIIEEQPFEFTLVSRRSRERSGLRYQRRGINENGEAANFVETEQLLRIVVSCQPQVFIHCHSTQAQGELTCVLLNLV